MSTAELRKAALMMASLEPDEAAGLLARLDPGQAQMIASEMGKSVRFSDEERRRVLDQLTAAAAASELSKAELPPAAGPAAPVRSSYQPPFAFLRRTDTPLLAAALADEHPQTIALVLSHLPASDSAQVIARTSADVASSVIRRLAAIAPASADVVDDVARGLERHIARLRRR